MLSGTHAYATSSFPSLSSGNPNKLLTTAELEMKCALALEVWEQPFGEDQGVSKSAP